MDHSSGSEGESGVAAQTFESFLVSRRLVSPLDIEKAHRIQCETGVGLISALRSSLGISGQSLARATGEFFGTPVIDETTWRDLPPGFEALSHAFLRENRVFPIAGPDGSVLLAMEDPTDFALVKAVRLALERPVLPCAASLDDIQAAIQRTARGRSAVRERSVESEPSDSANDDVEHLRDMALGAPVVRFVNEMIEDALDARATDIHVEPFDGRVGVRIRVDGILRDLTAPPAQMAKAVVSRIKILSGINIAERRLPQDGRARIKVNDRRIDLRVATMPNIHGEAVTIRLLDNARRQLDLGALGFLERDQKVLCKHLEAPYGLILVTGPTGSGKTTTLATALSLLNTTHRKILSIEDPIEYELDGINQTQAKPSIGLTFAAALRSFLRHDPDVLMVGEMRDPETAGIGIHAALTGHLVLSTLHTNTAAGAIPRLLDMGIDAYLLASSLRCVVAQRLVRVLCPHCKTKTRAPESVDLLHESAGDREAPRGDAWVAVGCERCYGTGYSDRMVISEVLDVDEEIRAAITPNAQPAAIEAMACRKGMTTMVADGLAKCGAGLTTLEEVRRVALEI